MKKLRGERKSCSDIEDIAHKLNYPGFNVRDFDPSGITLGQAQLQKHTTQIQQIPKRAIMHNGNLCTESHTHTRINPYKFTYHMYIYISLCVSHLCVYKNAKSVAQSIHTHTHIYIYILCNAEPPPLQEKQEML